ncbi:hypothetical protein SCHPADRAFT_840191 [Schizopora paradoxa]|uniref:DUF4100 domain-containing protein n=1 Tax=Schizopora paradoxa TaxID=27342 RepID=A0A0H2QZH7_9AGAM|nr:hypothetical protein SCHPADRAFT_840191 [Schizopora paradoxa]
MPRRGDRGAPAFDGDGPALLRYFEDVEMCIEECAIESERMKKRYLVRYTDATTAETWESLAEYGDDTKTYKDFKNAVIGLFPGMEPERRYGVRDLEALVDLWEEKGIKTKAELGEFHQAFLRVSTFLVSKQRLSKPEIQRLYLPSFQSQRPNGCIFCGGNHFVRECQEVQTYIDKGLAGRNERGQVCLPNGYFVPGYVQGATLRERIDNYHRMAASGGSGNKPPKKVTFDGVVIPVRPDGRKTRSTEGDTSGKGKEQSDPAPTKSATPATFKPALKDSGPQFRYVSAVEDPRVVTKVLDRMLDATVAMTNREVLAISNEVRKGVKELVQTKKVGSGATAEMLFSAAGDWTGEWTGPGALVKDSLPLRAIEGIFEGKIICECVLDQGAQFIAVRKDVWKAMDVPRYDDRTVTLEAANKTKSQTLGQASMRMVIGPICLTIVAHVVETAPFEVLLGRPFYAATACVTKDEPNGEQEITLTGPNGEGTITVATKAKSLRRRDEEQEVLHTGF